MRVLLVEDEKNLSSAVCRLLSREHIVADAVYTGPEGLDCALSGGYDAIILDVMLPGMSGKDIDVDENAMKKPEAIIRSMTPRERRNPKLLNASRRKRIAAGSGTSVQDVNQLIRQFENAKDMMKKMTAQMKGGKGQRMMRRFPGFK